MTMTDSGNEQHNTPGQLIADTLKFKIQEG